MLSARLPKGRRHEEIESINSKLLVEIITALATAKVRFFVCGVCGGVAAVLHGVERMTVDSDIAIDFSSANVKRLTAVIAKLGLFPRVLWKICRESKKRKTQAKGIPQASPNGL